MALIDKIKSDINFRNKVIGGALVFTIVMVAGIVLVLSISSKNQEEEHIFDSPDPIPVVPFDSTRQVQRKSVVYRQMDFFQEENEKDFKIVNDEDNFGKTQEEIDKANKEADDEISEYIKQRKEKAKQVQRTENSSHNRNIGRVSSSSQNKKYNSYSEDEDDLVIEKEMNDYKSGRQKEEENKLSKTRVSQKKKAKTFEELPAHEQKRILLESGKSYYEETEEFQAMIISSGKVKNGDRINIITKEDAYINFEKIPKGTTITGIVSFGDNRLSVNFSTLRLKKKILKIDLTLYSLDGLEGLPLDSDSLKEDIGDTGVDEVSREVTDTRVGRIATSLFKSNRSREKREAILARDLICILVNNNVQY